MWERKEKLNLESKKYPFDRPGFLLGSIAIYKKFKHKTFINEELRSYLHFLYKNGIPINQGGTYPGYYYYNRGILERNPKSFKKKRSWVNQYRVIISRIKIIERILKATLALELCP